MQKILIYCANCATEEFEKKNKDFIYCKSTNLKNLNDTYLFDEFKLQVI